jgi:spermidine synthase
MQQRKLFILLFILLSCPLIADSSHPTPESVHKNISLFDKAMYYLYQPIAFFLPHIELRKPIYETETQYFNARVEEDEAGIRHLVFLPRNGSQGIIDPKQPEKIISNFMKYAFLALPALGHPPEKVLFIGLGGGIMPMYLRRHYPNAQIDIVEIDKEIPKIAEEYFNFKPDPKINIYIMDGRAYVNQLEEKYDIIFSDVYDANNIPFQFTTVEFFRQIKKHLTTDGIFAVNLANFGDNEFISAELNTMLNVFKNCYIFACKGNTNYVPIAFANSNATLEDLTKNAVLYNKQKRFGIDFEQILTTITKPKELQVLIGPSPTILTDDYIPVFE